jgi:DNA repair protein RecO (recombination protein O)
MYTESFGRASYLIGRNLGKKSMVSKALFMPLSILDMEVNHLPKREIQRVKESKVCFPFSGICTDLVRNMLALFIAEILYRVLKETGPDPRLFDYLYKSVHLLENTTQGIANYHLVFLLGLLRHLGVFPRIETQKEGDYFDMLNGVFIDKIPVHQYYLDEEESTVFARLLRISFENMSLYSFSRRDRVNIINRILEYYRLHLPEFPEIKSIAVMQSLFD